MKGDFSFWFSRYCQMFRGYYAYWLREWLKEFELNRQLIVINSYDFFKEENIVVNKVFSFLGLRRYSLTKDQLKDKGVTKDYPPMKKETEKFLRNYFQYKNQELYELIGKDFGW